MLAQPVGRPEDHNWNFSGSSKVTAIVFDNFDVDVPYMVHGSGESICRGFQTEKSARRCLLRMFRMLCFAKFRWHRNDTIKLSGWEREFCTGAKLILLNKIRSGAADYSKKNRHSTTHSTMWQMFVENSKDNLKLTHYYIKSNNQVFVHNFVQLKVQ